MAVSDAIDSFIDDDASEDDRKSQFLIAGLAALGRISDADLSNFPRGSIWTLTARPSGAA